MVTIAQNAQQQVELATTQANIAQRQADEMQENLSAKAAFVAGTSMLTGKLAHKAVAKSNEWSWVKQAQDAGNVVQDQALGKTGGILGFMGKSKFRGAEGVKESLVELANGSEDGLVQAAMDKASSLGMNDSKEAFKESVKNATKDGKSLATQFVKDDSIKEAAQKVARGDAGGWKQKAANFTNTVVGSGTKRNVIIGAAAVGTAVLAYNKLFNNAERQAARAEAQDRANEANLRANTWAAAVASSRGGRGNAASMVEQLEADRTRAFSTEPVR